MNKISSFHFGHWFEMTSSSFSLRFPVLMSDFGSLLPRIVFSTIFRDFLRLRFPVLMSGFRVSYSRENVFSTIFRDRKRIGIGGIRTADLPNMEPRLYLSTTVFLQNLKIFVASLMDDHYSLLLFNQN